MTYEQIHAILLGFLQRKGSLPRNFSDSTDYLDEGIVDSIGIIKLVLDIESRFGIEIYDTEIQSTEFRTVQGLCAMISRKTAEGVPS
jgi:acyl carrier protein